MSRPTILWDFNFADQLSRRRELCGLYLACVPLRHVPPLDFQCCDTEPTRQESIAPAPSLPTSINAEGRTLFNLPINTRESAYIYKSYSVRPLPSLLTPSHSFSVFQASPFGCAKRRVAHRDILFAHFFTPFTRLFSHFKEPIPRVIILVNPTRLPQDLLMEIRLQLFSASSRTPINSLASTTSLPLLTKSSTR